MIRILILSLFFVAVSIGIAEFPPGARVRVVQNEPMLFEGRTYRTGKSGEEFIVLQHKVSTNTVFISFTEPNGRRIALSLPESAVQEVSIDTRAIAVSAAQALAKNNYPLAVAELKRLQSHFPNQLACSEAVQIVQSAIQSQQSLTAMMANVVRIRRNATVAGRPNALDKRDTSNQKRATSLRVEAAKIERQMNDLRRVFEESVASATVKIDALGSLSSSQTVLSFAGSDGLSGGKTANPQNSDPSTASRMPPVVSIVPFSMPGIPQTPASTVPASGGGIIEVEATGAGATADEALRDALRDASHRAVGTFISAEQIVKNEKLITDQIVAYSDAFVQGYDKTGERHENGLFHVTIKARVVRAKLAQQLSQSGLVGKSEVEGKGMFAEAVTKLEKAKAAKELLAKLFDGFPQSVCRATLVGKPAITGQTDKEATVRLRVRVGVDSQAYTIWHSQAVKILQEICLGASPFEIPQVNLRPGDIERRFSGHNSRIKLYTSDPPTANDDPKIPRLNLSLDGLAPFLVWNHFEVTKPRSGMFLFLSKTMAGFYGKSYQMDEDGYAAIVAALQVKGKHDRSDYRSLTHVVAAFKNSEGAIVSRHSLRLPDFNEHNDWFAPYGPMEENQYGRDFQVRGVKFERAQDARLMFIRPAFILDQPTFLHKQIKSSTSVAILATSGAAFDFDLHVSVEEMRKFERVDLSLGLPDE